MKVDKGRILIHYSTNIQVIIITDTINLISINLSTINDLSCPVKSIPKKEFEVLIVFYLYKRNRKKNENIYNDFDCHEFGFKMLLCSPKSAIS